MLRTASLAILLWTPLPGADPQPPLERAKAFQEATTDKVAQLVSRPTWSQDGKFVVYRLDLGGGQRRWKLADGRGLQGDAFDHEALAHQLGQLLQRPLRADRLPLETVASPEAGTVDVRVEGKLYRWIPATGSLAFRPSDAAPTKSVFPSPDGRLEALVQDHNVVVRQVKDRSLVFRSQDGNFADAYTGELRWSPDSKKLLAVRTLKVEERKVWFVESRPVEQFAPKLHTEDYAKPGDPLPKDRPQLFDLERRVQLPVSDALAPNPYEISRLRWAADSRAFTYLYNQRGHQLLRVLRVDAATGETRILVEETGPTFIDYSGKCFLEFLDDRRELVWMSERSGWNHLYLVDGETGKVKRALTRGEWAVRDVAGVNPKTRTVIFRAGGFHPGQDPYHLHLLKVGLDGGEPVALTAGDCTHVATFNLDCSLFVDVASRVDLPPTAELRRTADGERIAVLGKADLAELEKTGWCAPERFTAKGRDGKTDIWGVIWRPSTFDASKRYPVVEYIYAGPHSAHVPKAFRAFHSPQFLAEAGFIVVQMDGMGTSHRSKAFHDVCWQNLGDSGFPDRMAWIKAAAAKHPELDLSKGVGIYGGSAGGQSALRALLAYGDFYTVAVSDCGCHDNRVDKIWWNEQWMGWPIGQHYEAQSNVTQASKLKGKLLLTVGETDHNVDPASTLQVVDALIKADKDFDLLVFPGKDHWLLEDPYFKRRMVAFFTQHLK